MRPALFAALLFPLLAVNGLAVFGPYEMGNFAILSAIAIAFLAVKGTILYAAWRVCSGIYPPARVTRGASEHREGQ